MCLEPGLSATWLVVLHSLGTQQSSNMQKARKQQAFTVCRVTNLHKIKAKLMPLVLAVVCTTTTSSTNSNTTVYATSTSSMLK